MAAPRFLIPFHQELLSGAGNVAVFNAQSDAGFEMLGENITVEQDNARLFKALSLRGLNLVERIEEGEFDRALVSLGKHSEANKAMIGRAWKIVKEGGDLLIEGAKTDGVDSIIRGMKALGLAPNVEPKAHGKIAWLAREKSKIGAINAWEEADAAFVNEGGFHVRPGIFSSKAVDKGTGFLLEELRAPLKGKVADFGGGYGAISREILARHEEIEALDLYEVSHLACECAKKNIADDRAHIHWLDVKDAAKEHFNAIISNPPFHQGRKGDPSIGWEFIDAAARSLRARGSFYMVANRHLPYEDRLNARFGHVEVLAQSNAYKIFKATRPKSR